MGKALAETGELMSVSPGELKMWLVLVTKIKVKVWVLTSFGIATAETTRRTVTQ